MTEASLTGVVGSLVRRNVPALDALLGVKHPVLDQGVIVAMDYMGDDYAVVEAARTSYGHLEAYKDEVKNEGLLRALMRDRHTSPFEMAELKLYILVPMDLWRQWIRHRTANVNEASTRYKEARDEKARTKPEAWRLQSKNNKQGSRAGELSWPADGPPHLAAESSNGRTYTPGQYLSMREVQLHELAAEVYQERLLFDVAKEQARKDLPLSTYTEAVWKCDLHNLMHFLRLRMDPHAQLEIRQCANVIAGIVQQWVPMVWRAFQDYVLEARTFSRQEMIILRELLKTSMPIERAIADHIDLIPSEREREQFRSKLIA